MRDSAQPVSPLRVRTRDQSSSAAGGRAGAARPAAEAGGSGVRGRDNSSQFGGRRWRRRRRSQRRDLHLRFPLLRRPGSMNRNRLRGRKRRAVGGDAMPHHLDAPAFGNLEETGRLAVRLGVDVQRLIGRSRTLRGQLGRAGGQPPQIAHLPLAQKQVDVGPPFHAAGGAHFHKPPPRFDHLQMVAVLDRRHHRRLGAQFAAEIEIRRTRVGRSGSLLRKRRGTAPTQPERQKQSQQCGARTRACRVGTPADARLQRGQEPGLRSPQPMPKSSMRSSGVPQRRQIKEAQSPHANGSVTGWRH